eukprot:906966-Pleurochrysis_carterae.AAC.1
MRMPAIRPNTGHANESHALMPTIAAKPRSEKMKFALHPFHRNGKSRSRSSFKLVAGDGGDRLKRLIAAVLKMTAMRPELNEQRPSSR